MSRHYGLHAADGASTIERDFDASLLCSRLVLRLDVSSVGLAGGATLANGSRRQVLLVRERAGEGRLRTVAPIVVRISSQVTVDESGRARLDMIVTLIVADCLQVVLLHAVHLATVGHHIVVGLSVHLEVERFVQLQVLAASCSTLAALAFLDGHLGLSEEHLELLREVLLGLIVVHHGVRGILLQVRVHTAAFLKEV